MWEMCLSQKRKPKEEEEGPTLHQSPPEEERSPSPWLQACSRNVDSPRLLLPWPSPKKGLRKCQSFLQQISKIKMQSHVVWGPGVTPDTQLFPPNGCATYSQPPEGPGEPVNAINHKG